MTTVPTENPPLALVNTASLAVLEPREAIAKLEHVMMRGYNPEALDVLKRLNKFNLPRSRKGEILVAGVFHIEERLPLSRFRIDETASRATAEIALTYAVRLFSDPELLDATADVGLPIVCMEPINNEGKSLVISFGLKKGTSRQPFIGLSEAKLLPEACGHKYCPLYCR